MTCGPFMCSSSPHCGDTACPGHPVQLAAHSRIGVEDETPDYDYTPAEDISAGAALAGFAAVAILVFALAGLACYFAPIVAATFH
jgi:hypothetical protein